MLTFILITPFRTGGIIKLTTCPTMMRKHQPDICDDDKMFAVSLVAVEVREAHFNCQIGKSCVLHLTLAVGWEVAGLRPFNGSPVS